MPQNEMLTIAQIRADMFLAKSAIEEAERLTSSKAKYLKGLAGYHLQQATEKLIKIQIYNSGANINYSKMYKHRIDELVLYANSLGVDLDLPKYIDKYSLIISGWEADGRYDVHVVVRLDTLKKCYSVIEEWCERVKSSFAVSGKV